MSNIKSYTDKELLERVKTLPTFKGFPNGVLDIWVRSNEDEFDRFDDKVYTFLCHGDEREPEFIMVCTGTTNAGSFGLKQFKTYNPKGCAVLKSDIIVYNSHVYGLHKGKPAYIQSFTVPFPYYRDGNMNNRCDEVGEVYTDRIGANCHRAGVFSTVISNWSVACLVRNQLSQFGNWLDFMIKRGKPNLSVCILKEF
jgi:hypothetical protein